MLTRDDDYASLGKPPCDWEDPKAREALVDALVGDATAALEALHGRKLDGTLGEVVELLALDILARASAINLARLATLGLHPDAEGWAIA